MSRIYVVYDNYDDNFLCIRCATFDEDMARAIVKADGCLEYAMVDIKERDDEFIQRTMDKRIFMPCSCWVEYNDGEFIVKSKHFFVTTESETNIPNINGCFIKTVDSEKTTDPKSDMELLGKTFSIDIILGTSKNYSTNCIKAEKEAVDAFIKRLNELDLVKQGVIV